MTSRRDWRRLLQVSTLRFATRMMCVASEPALNEHYDPAVGYALTHPSLVPTAAAAAAAGVHVFIAQLLVARITVTNPPPTLPLTPASCAHAYCVCVFAYRSW